MVLKDDALNYDPVHDTVPSGTSKSGLVFRQNKHVILLFWMSVLINYEI